MQRLLSCILISSVLWIVALADNPDDDGHGMPHAVAYDAASFASYVSRQPHFIMFYAPW